MTRENERPVAEVAEADRIDQEREVLAEAPDPEAATTSPLPEGVEADPADVLDQSIEVPEDDGRDPRAE